MKNKNDQFERVFKFYPEDFMERPAKPVHMELDFDIHPDKARVQSNLRVLALDDFDTLELNAKELEILDVSCDEKACTHRYDSIKSMLTLLFTEPVAKGTEITIKTDTQCRPSRSTLEGLYYDVSPEGTPPTMITQCQQWGFQRIVPCFDDMTAKCTYRTKIIADARYTDIISNGDISIKRHKVSPGRDSITYDNTKTPMAPYLFFLCVGTYSSFTREFEYPDGSTFDLQLLAPPETREERAHRSLEILADSVLWVYLFTGPDALREISKRKRIRKLCIERDSLKQEDADEQAGEVRLELQNLSRGLTFGYKYTGTVYREIGMQNTNWGGMENVGNTTITTNRLLPFPDISDASLEYLFRVKVHEFYHNINGSEVTGWSPFELWLNEAVTVFIEKQYASFLFGDDYSRLTTVSSIISPGGTFEQDEGTASMPVIPDGFNSPDELISAVTYVKAPEIIRMIWLLMGEESFNQALDRYYRTYKHANATTEDFLNIMSDVSGKDIIAMAGSWLRRTGFVTLLAETAYQEKDQRLVINLEQECLKGEEREFPFGFAVFGERGEVLHEETVYIKEKNETIELNDIHKPGFISLNRGMSFFGKVDRTYAREELLLQAEHDTDIINRHMAFRKLIDIEMTGLLETPGKDVNSDISRLYMRILENEELMLQASPLLVSIPEKVEDPRYAHAYGKLYHARETILSAIANRHREGLYKLYEKYREMNSTGDYITQTSKSMKARLVKNAALMLIARLGDQEALTAVHRQYYEAFNATDRNTAYGLMLRFQGEERDKVFNDMLDRCRGNLVVWESMLSLTSGSSSIDVIGLVKRLESSGMFHVERTNDTRSLYSVFANNRMHSLETIEGRDYLKYAILKTVDVNEYITGSMLKVFANIDRMEEEHKSPMVALVRDILSLLDAEKTPSAYNTLKRIMKSTAAFKE